MKAVLLFGILVCVFACTTQPKTKSAFSKTEHISYAKYLSIIEHPQYTEIQIINPDQKGIEKKYALVKDIRNCNFPGDCIPIEVPLKSIITLCGTDIGMLDKIHCADKIKGVSNMNYIANRIVQEKFRQGKVIEVQDFNQLNPEKVLTASKLITYSGFGTAPVNEEKLNKLDIICLPVYDWREIHPLGKAEWIKLYGYLFGKETQAELYFRQISSQFISLEKKAAKLKEHPTVLSGSMIGDSWYMPASESYNAYLIRAAGANFIAKTNSGTGSSSFTFEDVYKRFKNADYWINPGFSSKNSLLKTNSKYDYFTAFKQNRIYCYSHRMNYFWENSAIEPQHVLSDLIQIFHENEIAKKKLYFYKKLK